MLIETYDYIEVSSGKRCRLLEKDTIYKARIRIQRIGSYKGFVCDVGAIKPETNSLLQIEKRPRSTREIKFGIGSKVRVRRDFYEIATGEQTAHCGITRDMENEYGGRVGTISDVSAHGNFKVGAWFFHPEWLDPM